MSGFSTVYAIVNAYAKTESAASMALIVHTNVP
jgi:hypothetical protein